MGKNEKKATGPWGRPFVLTKTKKTVFKKTVRAGLEEPGWDRGFLRRVWTG